MEYEKTPTENVRRRISNPRRPALKFLCVEDNEGDFILLKDHLRHAGFSRQPEVQGVGTLQGAIVLLEKHGDTPPFDLVFLDLSLPDSSGALTYHRLRSVSPRVAVIILSGNGDAELAEQMVHEGAQDYLPKEILTPDLLMRSTTYALSRQRSRVELEKLAERLKKTTEELRTAQMHLAQAEKLDSICRLAASVAHEVKNPLGTIQMGLDFLATHCVDRSETCQRTLAHMQDAVTRADSVIHDMLNFSRSDDSVRMEPIVVNDLVRCVLRIVRHELDSHHITCESLLADDVPMTVGDNSKLEQVLINIITNSVQAMKKNGHIEIRTSRTRVGSTKRDEGLREMDRLRPGDDAALIEITDNGPGIPQDIMRRVFEPFFTTKPAGEGTGLGLSVSKRIIELHRGQLQIFNAEGGAGVRVRIFLQSQISDNPNHNGIGTAPMLQPAASTHSTPL